MALRQTFKAMVVSETHEKTFEREIKERDLAALPPGELLIEVKYSSLNYKDALSASGNKGITKKYPHTLGVDAAGVVLGCSNRTFAVGDEVIVTGFDLGMNTPGGIRPVHQRSGELGTQGAAGSVAERGHETPMSTRLHAWQKLAGEWRLDLSSVIAESSLDELNPKIDQILKGGIRGRVVVDLRR
jgi:D-arabinose 1-dehydrogenase-like Zn-dependent alcohol dehydrogenase